MLREANVDSQMKKINKKKKANSLIEMGAATPSTDEKDENGILVLITCFQRMKMTFIFQWSRSRKRSLWPESYCHVCHAKDIEMSLCLLLDYSVVGSIYVLVCFVDCQEKDSCGIALNELCVLLFQHSGFVCCVSLIPHLLHIYCICPLM